MALITFIYINVVLYGSFLYQYLWESNIAAVKPVYFLIATTVIGALLAIFKFNYRLPAPKFRAMILWVLAFLVVSYVSMVVSGTTEAGIQQWLYYAEGTAIFVVFLFLLRSEWILRHAMIAMAFVGVISAAVNILEFIQFFPIEMSVTPGRSAGMFRNPNASGMFIVLSMAISVFVLPKIWRAPFVGLLFIGALLTFSRSTMLISCIVIAYLAYRDTFVLPKVPSFLLVGGMVAAFLIAIGTGALVEYFGTVGADQYLDDNTQDRVGKTFWEWTDHSATSRAAAAEVGFDLILENPLFGIGIGQATDLVDKYNAHNQYLQIGIEMGLPGIMFLLGLYFMLWKSKSIEAEVLVLALVAYSFFTHNILDQPTVYMLLALAMACRPSRLSGYAVLEDLWKRSSR